MVLLRRLPATIQKKDAENLLQLFLLFHCSVIKCTMTNMRVKIGFLAKREKKTEKICNSVLDYIQFYDTVQYRWFRYCCWTPTERMLIQREKKNILFRSVHKTKHLLQVNRRNILLICFWMSVCVRVSIVNAQQWLL